MKRTFSFLLCLALLAGVLPLRAQIRGFRQTELRQWEFSQTGASWDSVAVPHTMPAQTGTYRCTFTVRNPKAPAYLFFERAAQTVTVKVNGDQVAYHQGGYTGFPVRITDAIKDGENLVEVECDASPDEEMAPVAAPFPLHGGLTGAIWLAQMEDVYFAPEVFGMYRVRCETPEVTDKKVVTNIKARIVNDSGRDVTVKIRMQMLDEEGRLAYQADRKVDMVSYGEYDFEHDFVLAGIHRWDGLRDPFLYTIRMELFQDRRIFDIAETKIGYRSLELDRERGLLLNGRPCPLHGSILEGGEENGSEASVRAALAAAVARGDNFVMMPYFPHGDFVFRQADSLGLAVLPQTPWLNACGSRARQTYFNNIHTQLEEMVNNLYNHPSVLLWGMWNGVDGRTDTADLQGAFDAEKAVEQTRRLYELGKELDPDRFFGVVDRSELRPEGYAALKTDFVVEAYDALPQGGLSKATAALRATAHVPVGAWITRAVEADRLTSDARGLLLLAAGAE